MQSMFTVMLTVLICLVDSVKAVRAAGEFFSLLETLYVFLSSSKCHVISLNSRPVYIQRSSIGSCRSSLTQDGLAAIMQSMQCAIPMMLFLLHCRKLLVLENLMATRLQRQEAALASQIFQIYSLLGYFR